MFARRGMISAFRANTRFAPTADPDAAFLVQNRISVLDEREAFACLRGEWSFQTTEAWPREPVAIRATTSTIPPIAAQAARGMSVGRGIMPVAPGK